MVLKLCALCGDKTLGFLDSALLRYVDWSPDCDSVLSGKKNNRGGRRGTIESI
jgi:hypothetical protein